MPYTILATPLNNKANATNAIKIPTAKGGYATDISAKTITITPSPMLDNLDNLLPRNGENIPLATLSIPTINKVIASIKITVNTPRDGYARTMDESIIDTTPTLI